MYEFTFLLTRHLCATLGARNIIARLAYPVGYLVVAVGADAVATRTSRLVTTHTTRSAALTSAALSATLSSAALSTSSSHLPHLLSS